MPGASCDEMFPARMPHRTHRRRAFPSLQSPADIQPHPRRHALAANLSWQFFAFAVVFPLTMVRL